MCTGKAAKGGRGGSLSLTLSASLFFFPPLSEFVQHSTVERLEKAMVPKQKLLG